MIFFQCGEKEKSIMNCFRELFLPGLGCVVETEVVDDSDGWQGIRFKTWMGEITISDRNNEGVDKAIELYKKTIKSHNNSMQNKNRDLINGFLATNGNEISGLGVIKQEVSYFYEHDHIKTPNWKRIECQMGYIDVPL